MIRLGRRLSRKTALAAAAGALALTGVASMLAGATPALAADTNDPYVSGCASGAYPVASAHITVGNPNTYGNTGFGLLHLMYSPSCRTNWAEFDSYAKGYKFALAVWSHANAANSLSTEQVDWTSNGDQVAWTDMVNGTIPAGVGVCQDTTSSRVLNTGFMSQYGTDLFFCHPSQTWGMSWSAP
ncbi:MAG TPA: DUF2690 domain-containing protein [Trebonia sp.]